MVGNIPNYSKFDVLRCYFRLEKITGRQELANELNLGEGTVRTMLNILKRKSLLSSSKKGHELSSKGKTQLDNILGDISIPHIVKSEKLYPEFNKVGIAIRNKSYPKEATKLRDIAVKNGAEGAVILIFDGTLRIPGYAKQNYNEMLGEIEIAKGDILIVCFSKDHRSAENGCLAIGSYLSANLGNFINNISN